MKQNIPPETSTTMLVQAGWSVRKLKAQMRSRGVTARQVADRHAISHQGVRLTIRGLREGLVTRQAIAQELGVDVTQIWPDALLPVRERRLRKAS